MEWPKLSALGFASIFALVLLSACDGGSSSGDETTVMTHRGPSRFELDNRATFASVQMERLDGMSDAPVAASSSADNASCDCQDGEQLNGADSRMTRQPNFRSSLVFAHQQ